MDASERILTSRQIGGLLNCARDLVWAPVLEHSYSITCSKVRSEMNAFWWSGNGFGIGFLRIRIELRVQKVFGNVVRFGGPPPVLGSGFENSY